MKSLWFVLFLVLYSSSFAKELPLAEHPRPDWHRPLWQNLNGDWAFQYDADNQGLKANWQNGAVTFSRLINVPFSWGSQLSGIEDQADIGWYRRNLRIPLAWQKQRVFLVIGACDWHTTAWLDGKKLGEHRGGYTPFEFEITGVVKYDQEQTLILRVDDTPHPFKLEGKQGYGPARGIWQTPYLECRGSSCLSFLHLTPDIDHNTVTVHAQLLEPAVENLSLRIAYNEADGAAKQIVQKIKKKSNELAFEIKLTQPRLWTLDDPYLYDVTAILSGAVAPDTVKTYFGMRKISVMNLPGTQHPYIALNNKPLYLQLALDQAYHEQGFYTYESDAFMRDEILRSKRIGLNGLREHVKIEIPRKLYWADKLGLLIMADVPNSWGKPDADMRQEAEYAFMQMLQRDFNHPAIFSWVLFNETWGLGSGKEIGYAPETQKWVADLFQHAKKMDPSRLVEDNSPCNYDHVVTDINSWHAYLPGYGWQDFVKTCVDSTFPGSRWNFAPGYLQAKQPLLNSECGNVWGYEGSSGDVDWSWDYHIMLNTFRSYPKLCGWLYTELHDVINEWNGYYRFDRSNKYTGLEDLVPDMTLKDLHSALYIIPQTNLSESKKAGETVQVPLAASFLTDQFSSGTPLLLTWRLIGWDQLGREQQWSQGQQSVIFQPWFCGVIAPITVTMPQQPSVSILQIFLKNRSGQILHRNFTCFIVQDENREQARTVTEAGIKIKLLSVEPQQFKSARFSQKQWSVLDGLKVNGAGFGYIEYQIPWPADVSLQQISSAGFIMEASAKKLYGKDREDIKQSDGDYMRGKGFHDPSQNRNAYPMTDENVFPSCVRVRVNGETVGVYNLPDDPADHRGILSWHNQLRDKYLREAGSYGYLVQATLPLPVLEKAQQQKNLIIRLEVDDSLPGGLAIYGRDFGRYPLDPTVVMTLK